MNTRESVCRRCLFVAASGAERDSLLWKRVAVFAYLKVGETSPQGSRHERPIHETRQTGAKCLSCASAVGLSQITAWRCTKPNNKITIKTRSELAVRHASRGLHEARRNHCSAPHSSLGRFAQICALKKAKRLGPDQMTSRTSFADGHFYSYPSSLDLRTTACLDLLNSYAFY